MSSSYLVPGTGADGTQLWVVTVNDDGTASSHELVALYPGGTPYPGGSAFTPPGSLVAMNPYFTPFKNGFLFVASGIADESTGPNYPIYAGGTKTGREMWYTDGTAAGTHLIYDANPGVNSQGVGNDGITGNPHTTLLVGGKALFVAAINGSGQTGLFVTDGTSSGSYQLQATGINFTYPMAVTALNGEALFTATLTSASGSYGAVFVTDGTGAGTHRISTETTVNIVQASVSAAGRQEVFFTGTGDGQLWVTDGTTTTQLTSASSVSAIIQVGSFGKALVDLGNGTELFFTNPPGSTHLDLWATDGTPGATGLIDAAIATAVGTTVGSYGSFVTASGHHEGFFETSGGTGGTQALFVSDGTAAGTTAIATWAYAPVSGPIIVGNHLIFGTAATGAQGQVTTGLSATDGTAAGTVVLATSGVSLALHSGPGASAVFSETDATGTNLFITNGTVAGTHAITTGLTYFGNYTLAGSSLFFTANNSAGTAGLWAVGATGTATELNIGADKYVSGLSAVGTNLFFNAKNAANGTDTWISNGTQAGTHIVQGAGFVTTGSGSNPFTAPLPCFLAGTRLRTPTGEVAVETLREGDLILTASGVARPVIWVGQREVDLARHPSPERVRPVRIRAGAFGPRLPSRDLLLSPDHAVHLDGVLIPAQCLIDGISVTQEAPRRAHYFHVELPLHDIVLAEGLAVESYLETGNRDAFDGDDAAVQLHPDFWALHWENACAPLVLAGPVVDAARARLRHVFEAAAAA